MNMRVSISIQHMKDYCTMLPVGLTSGPASTDHPKAISLCDGSFMICGTVATPECRNKRYVLEVDPTMLDIMGGECLNLCRFEGEGLLLFAI